MKIFISIFELIAFISIIFIIELYIYKKYFNIFKLKIWILISFIFITSFFPLFSLITYSFNIHGLIVDYISSIGYIIGGFLIYFFLISLILFLIVFFIKKIFKNKMIKKNKIINIILIFIISITSISICIYGYYSCINYVVESVNVDTNINNLKIVTLSDIHYGTTCSTLKKEKLIKKVNSINADLIFLVGDIFDNDIDYLSKEDFTSFIDGFDSKYGTYAVLGNHELKQNSLEEIISFYSESKVKLLLDEEIIIDDKIRIIGRIDYSFSNRKKLKDIASESNIPLIVLDHQTINFKEAKDIGAIIQYSGHTHNGQIFPYNLILFLYYKLFYDSPINSINKYDNFYLIICRGTSNWGFPYKTTGPSQIIFTSNN